jgi:molybdopterin molybdotransferase
MTRKLIDDCFRSGSGDGQRLAHGEALALIRDRVAPVVASQQVPLAAALGRIAARDIAAPIAVPGHTNSAVDGYAFAHRDYDRDAGSTLPVVGRLAAGGGASRKFAAGTAARIFTGAMLSPPLDTVAMQEDCGREDGKVFVPAGLKAGANVRRAGEDVDAGERVVAAGAMIRAPEIAQLAALGIAHIEVFERPRVGLVATGDEVRRGGVLGLGEVYDVNTPLLTALLSNSVAMAADLGVWPDGRGEVIRRLGDAAGRFDLILTSGGASQGEEDHISHALAALGSRAFWQIAVKPGRPLMLGQIGDTVVVGLPGNPVAVFACFLMYVFPLLRQLGGGAWREPRRFSVPAAFTFEGRKVGRREFWRGTLVAGPDGLVVTKFPHDGSGLISGLRAANGLIDIAENVPGVVPGQMVDFIPFSEFGIID